MFKIAFKYIGFRYRQHRRKTSEKLVVDTVYGPVRGVKRISCWDDPYYSFERIPFAKPPVGELRFAEPQPPEPWTKIQNCGKEPPMPMQHNIFVGLTHGSESCLYLNVYTPKIHPKELKPVMVWIYGGGFQMGGANRMIYGPDYFMQKDVVLVTINYRVGPLGFLSLKDPKLKVPGNAGLKDQIMGIKWVKANITNFGGNPDSITLFGESAGSASSHLLMLTNQTKNLFHRAILMSGTALCTWACSEDKHYAYRLARKLGYTGEENEEKILEFLLKCSSASIATANSTLMTEDERDNGMLFIHGPVIEPYETEQCVIPRDPMLMAREAWSNDIPVIIGGCANEGFIFNVVAKKVDIKKSVGNCEKLIPDIAKGNKEKSADHMLIRKSYFGTEDASIMPLFELMGDRNFWHPIRRTLRSRLTYGTGANYLYRFAVESKLNMLCRLIGGQKKGTCHGDDFLHLFFGVLTLPVDKSSKEYRVIQQFVGMFTQFAKTGDPNIAEIEPTVWKPASKDDVPIKCLNIGDDVSVIDMPDQDRLDLWDSFYPEDKLI